MEKFNFEYFVKIFIPLYLILSIIIFIFLPSPIIIFAQFLAGLSTVGIFILTSFYVYYTNKQIIELQKQRELQIQPLPNIEILKGEVSSPKLRVDYPAKGKLVFRVDFNLFLKMRNTGNGTAVLIDVFCSFVGNKLKYKENLFNADRFFVLEQGHEKEFTYILHDNQFHVLNIINQEVEEVGDLCIPLTSAFDILVETNVLYKNILGSPFLIKYYHMIYIDDHLSRKVSEWLATMSSFDNVFSSEISRYNTVYRRNKEEALEIFYEIEGKYNEKCCKEILPFHLLPVDQLFSIDYLDKEKYEEILERINHGLQIRPKTEH